MPSMSLAVPKNSDLHRKLVAMLESRIKLAVKRQGDQHAKWKAAEENILAYVPEGEVDALRRSDRDQRGLPKYTTIKIPYSYALLMAAHTYWTSVFFARSPVHQFVGRHGEGEQQVQAIEALTNYQVEVGGALAPYYIWLYDAGKYGIGILGTYWDKETIRYSAIEQQVDEQGRAQKFHVTREVEGYEGNRVYNVSPFDFLPDPRVSVGQFQRGEFVAIKRRIPWNEVIRRKRQGYYINTEEITQHTGTQNLSQQWSQLDRPSEQDWISDGIDDKTSKHPSTLHGYEVYVDLIPSEWGLPGGDFPEKWVFTITADYSVLIGVQPLGTVHGKFPFDVIEPEVEAYGMWNRGIPEIVEPLQNTMDWLLNTHFYNVRAALNNMFIADPSRIVIKDLQNPEPGLVARLKPEAYGADIRSFFQQLNVQDVTGQHVGDLQMMLGIGERITGINDQILGVLQGGGRKTATEVRTSTGFGINRLKTAAEYMSVQGFSPHAQKWVQQSQQYYEAEKQLRIVGDLAMQDGGRFLIVDPESIVGSFDFVPVDGTLPVDRMAQANLWKEIMIALRNFPEVGMEFDMAKIFGHVALLGGIRNLQQFRRLGPGMPGAQMQVAPDEQLAQQASAGNLVPFKPGTDNRAGGLQPQTAGPAMPPGISPM